MGLVERFEIIRARQVVASFNSQNLAPDKPTSASSLAFRRREWSVHHFFMDGASSARVACTFLAALIPIENLRLTDHVWIQRT